MLLIPQMASANCERIRISYTTNWIPVAYDSADGEPSGIAIQIHREIFDRLGLPVEFVSGLPWRRQMEMLDTGEVDAIAAIHYNPEREKRLLLTDQISESVVHVYRNKNSTLRFQQLSDLKNYTGAIIKDASYGKEFDDYRQKNLSILEFTELDKIAELVTKGRVDYMVLPVSMSEYMIQNFGGEKDILKSGPAVLVQPIHMGFSRKSQCRTLVQAVNEQISSLKVSGVLNHLQVARYKK